MPAAAGGQRRAAGPLERHDAPSPPPEADTKQARLPPVVKHKRLGDSHPK